MKRLWTASLLAAALLLPQAADALHIGVSALVGRTDHQQYREPIGVSILLFRPISPKLTTFLELSHRQFQNRYFGESVSRHVATTVPPETVDNYSSSNAATLWVKSHIYSFGRGVIALAAGTGPVALDGNIAGVESGREVEYKRVTKFSGNLAVGVEALVSHSSSTFLNCYLQYQFLSSTIRVSSLPDPFATAIRGFEIRLGLSHIF